MSTALAVGVLLAVASLAYVLHPLVRARGTVSRRRTARSTVPQPPVSNREVTDDEIEAVVRSYRASHSAKPECPECGLRPEPDALYCSSCGRTLRRAAP